MTREQMARRLAWAEAWKLTLSEIEDILVDGTTRLGRLEGWIERSEVMTNEELKEAYESQFGEIETETMVAYLPTSDTPDNLYDPARLIEQLPNNPKAQIMTLEEFETGYNYVSSSLRTGELIREMGYVRFFQREKP